MTEHPFEPSGKKHNLLLDSCHSLGKGCSAVAAVRPHSGPLAFPGGQAKPCWLGPSGWP